MSEDGLLEWLDRSCARYPERTAVESDSVSLRYDALDAGSNRIARDIVARGIAPGSVVAVPIEDRVAMIVAMIGIFRAGCVFAPLDPTGPPLRLREIATDLRPDLFLTEVGLRERVSELAGDRPVLTVAAIPSGELGPDARAKERPRVSADHDALRYVYYTSGSTGAPKGIAGSLRSVSHFIRWEIDEFGIGEGFRVSQLTPPTFDPFFRDVLVPLCAGGTVCVPAEAPGETEPRVLLDWIEDRRINLIHCVPSLLRPVSPKDLGGRALRALQYILFAGERLHSRDVEKWLDAGGGRIQVVNLYGPSESTMVKFFHFVSRSEVERGFIPIGKPIPGATALVLGEDGKTCSPGEIGELFIRSAFLALGYYRRPELTREAFLPDPAGQGTDARMYKTGDLVRRREDGVLEFIGRKDLQLKIRGVRVEPGETESRLLEHERVRAAAVVGREDRLGEPRLVAYVVPSDPTPGVTELRRFLEEKLPEAMVPSSFLFLESLPLTRTGKVDRGALPAPGPERPDLGSPFVRPRTATEERLASIWADLLGLNEVGVEDDFFELGGNSLMAMRAVSRIRDALRVELPLRRLFESATVAQLARWIDASPRAKAGFPHPSPTPARRDGRTPLSFAQLRLWFLEQLEPGNPFYNIHEAHRLSGTLDVSALTKALGALVERQEVLRTTFPAEEGVPWASIGQAGPPDLSVIDLRSLPAERREAEILRIDREEEQRPFDLASGPLLRVKLLRAGEHEHVLMWTVHHIVFDGWSEEIFRGELSVLYDAFSSSSPAPTAPLPIQYADFAEWQRRWLEEGTLPEQLAYWKETLHGLTETLDLPTDRPRPAQQTHRGASRTHWLPARLAESVRALSRRERVTAFMTLLALFQTLLHRYSGSEDIAVGSPIAGRGASETESLVGFFVNTLVLRTNLSGDPSFRELLRRVREVCLGAFDHPDLPFERLVEELHPERSLSHHPLFQVFFAVENEPARPLELRGLAVRGLDTPKSSAKFDLTLSISERPEGLRLDFRYQTDLFDPESIARMADHFETLLEAAVANPERRLSELPILTSAERRQQALWNATEADSPRDRCVHVLFEEQVRRTPEASAVRFEGEQLTYAETNARANQLARHLRRRGVGPGSLVGLGVERSLDLVVGLLGILKAGAAFVPFDPSLPGERLGYMARDAGISMLLTHEHLLGRFPDIGPPAVCLDARTESESIFQGPGEDLVPEVTSRDLAYVIFTSGSTGRPKGVAVEHRSVVNLATALERAGVSPIESSPLRVSLNGPLAFDTSIKQVLQFLRGHALCIVPEETRLDPEALLAWLARESIHVFDCTPSQLRPLLAAGLLERPGLSLRRVLVGGEPIDAETWGVLARSERIRFFNLYGPTECTVDAAVCEIRSGLPRPVIGRPVANVQIHILDRHRQPVPVGVKGELWIGGEGVARGYWRRPELTAERFVPDPFRATEGSRLYRTGDLGRFRPDGVIELAGRADQQVKFRGFRIELEEIEAVLMEDPAVEGAAVLLREDASGQRLVAYVVPETGCVVRRDSVRAFAKRRLPDSMVPSTFVILDALPLTSHGKVDRLALPALDAADAGEPRGGVSPRTPLEETLAGVWAGLLGVPRVGVHDNFFDLGGHSLLAVQLLSRVRDAVGEQLPVRTLFAGPTVAEMAVAVTQSQARRLRADELERLLREVESTLPGTSMSDDLDRRIASLSPEQRALLEKRLREQAVPAGDSPGPIPRRREAGPARLSLAQERLWFLDQLEPGNAYYNIHKAVRWKGSLDPEALGRALETILERHDALRTTFVAVDGAPFQVVAPPGAWPLPVTDLRGLPRPEAEAQARRLAVEEARRPFDLSRDRLVRARLLRLGDDEHVFLLTIHHIVADGWSMGIFFGELAALYAAFSMGEPSPLPDLPIQYADFAHWQRDRLQGKALEAQLDYWKERLSGMAPVLDFPGDRPRPATRTGRGAGHTFSIPRKVLDGLRDLSRREGVTLYMTLLAAFQALLGRYADLEEIVVGSPEAGRHRVETEPLIGYFVNMLVLRTDLRGDPTFRELLARVRDVVLGAQAHPEVPFERLIDELGLDRSLRYNPVFQVMFAFQKAPRATAAPPGLTASAVTARSDAAVFDLVLEVTELPDGLDAGLGYHRDLFDDATAVRMVEHFRRLLEGVVEDSDRTLSRLPLSSEEERRRLLVEWNDTAAEFPAEKCVHRLFEDQAGRTPDVAAVVFGEERLTYRELNLRANRLARHLRRLGVGAGDVAGLCVERSIEMTVGLLGILKAGAAYLPLDPGLPRERLSLLLEESRTRVLLTQQRLVSSLPAFGGRRVLLDVGGDSPAIAHESEENVDGGASADDLAYVIYTSGSTGTPNGVEVSHRSLVNFTMFAAEAFGLGPTDRVLQFASITFDASAEEIYPCWSAGATLVLRTESMLDDLSSFLEACRRWSITVLDLPTAYWHDLVAGSAQEGLEIPEGLRLVVIGGESALPERLATWRERFGARVRLFNTYGPTEATVAATSWECPATGEEEDELRLRDVPIGRPIRNVQAYVLDRSGQPVPLGGWGELHIGGVGLARGYLGRAELTAARFVANPFSDRPGSRLYRSGDRARHRADGELELRGRLDLQLKIRGHRVEPGEVEAALAEHASVRDVAVVGREEAAGDRSLVAYVSLRPEPAVSAGDLKRFLRARLPSYMLPSHIVLLDALPRTSGGKPDRRSLESLPRPEPQESEFVAPRTATEQSLAGIWAEVLGIDRVGVHDNFFDLGGHSLLATRVLARLYAALSVRLPLRTLFDKPTVAEVAEVIEQLRGSGSGPSRSAIAPVSRRVISGQAGQSDPKGPRSE